MSCINSFQININQSQAFTGVALRTWGLVGDKNWAYYEENVDNSTYTIEGFKNINLHSVEMVGMMQTDVLVTSGASCIVSDYGIFLGLNGLLPSVSGKVDLPNDFFGISPTYNVLSLTKYTNKLTFDSPIQSLKSIEFRNLFAQGTNAESASFVALRYNLTFIFTYSYEGED